MFFSSQGGISEYYSYVIMGGRDLDFNKIFRSLLGLQQKLTKKNPTNDNSRVLLIVFICTLWTELRVATR
jgi:hypothetical protein